MYRLVTAIDAWPASSLMAIAGAPRIARCEQREQLSEAQPLPPPPTLPRAIPAQRPTARVGRHKRLGEFLERRHLLRLVGWLAAQSALDVRPLCLLGGELRVEGGVPSMRGRLPSSRRMASGNATPRFCGLGMRAWCFSTSAPHRLARAGGSISWRWRPYVLRPWRPRRTRTSALLAMRITRRGPNRAAGISPVSTSWRTSAVARTVLVTSRAVTAIFAGNSSYS
jgi:hypothetical protein